MTIALCIDGYRSAHFGVRWCATFEELKFTPNGANAWDDYLAFASFGVAHLATGLYLSTP